MTAYLDRDQPEKTHALGFPAYLKTDLVIRLGTGIEVVDWKTGRPNPKDVAQAEIYDLYVRMAELLPKTKPTRVHVVYLKTGHVDTREFGEAERTLALRQAHEGYLRIQDLFGARTAACLDPALFPPQPGGHCSGCNFQGLCPESATKQSAAPAAAAIAIEDDF
ncbi:MAG: PD-(D/E)XK nuclease family protein [Verrucomicrobiae bacterium]|nr:PD-(D/E)XK nuclease family protein [Verrucomicrobiae bacterium]